MSQEPERQEMSQEVPEHCPGVSSEKAGKSSACQGCPNQNICASGQANQPDPDIELIKDHLKTVKNKILILSGKGGVGKSTVCGQISYALAAHYESENKQIGVLDIDICGPSLPQVFGVQGEQIHQSGSGWSPIFVDENLSLMSIGFLLPSLEDAVIWRGPKKNGLIKQFLRDVDWEELEYLLVDTPPGTSDEHLSIVQYLKPAGLTGAIIVTTPQEVSLLDVRKEITFCKKVGVPIIGVVENMSGFACPKCKVESQIFPPSTGGAEKMCEEMDVNFLGRIPIDPQIGQCCDEGKSFIKEFPNSPATQAYNGIISRIHKFVATSQ
ncbi:unnamed protein product [Brachionus calyciflorus]|uniref:Cytosolic Fe-S cluster assembly factor NUBP1 homolog n=1 Tax=Brachionus calyciflorus TaxID=104777 RepID=A0A814ICR6_9BILA|nr:unnamed protein product [Brachionus calyciflorus]